MDTGELEVEDFGMERQERQEAMRGNTRAAPFQSLPQPRGRQRAEAFSGQSLEKTCSEFIQALEVCQQRVLSWNETELHEEFALTQQKLKSTREEYSLTVEELRQVEERQANLMQERERLLEELQFMRDAPTRGCSLS